MQLNKQSLIAIVSLQSTEYSRERNTHTWCVRSQILFINPFFSLIDWQKISLRQLQKILKSTLTVRMERRIILAILFTFFVLKLTRCSEEQHAQQTKPDPYFEEWKNDAWQRPSQCHGKLGIRYAYNSIFRRNLLRVNGFYIQIWFL